MELPDLAGLDIRRYAAEVDAQAAHLAGYLPSAEAEFAKSPGEWNDDPSLFRMGLLCWFVDGNRKEDRPRSWPQRE
jgi:hypothetical protein